MGLFDAIREKASELLSGVSEKAGDLAGDIPGADVLQDLTDSLGGATDQATDAADGLTDQASSAVEDIGAGASDTVDGAIEDLPGDPQP